MQYATPIVEGNGSANTSISLWAGNLATFILQNITIDNATGNNSVGLLIGEFTEVVLNGDVLFSSAAGFDVYAYDHGALSVNAGYSISGNKSGHFTGDHFGRYHHLGAHNVTLVGTPVFSTAFFVLQDQMNVNWLSGTSSDACTGPKWKISDGAVISGTVANIPGDAANVINTTTSTTAPITKTGDFTVGQYESSFICNGSGTITVTLPSATLYTGRWVTLKTIVAQTVVSASSNVVPVAGGAAGTAILAGTAGKWAELQSDGTNWIIMRSN